MGAWFICKRDARAEERLAIAKDEFRLARLPVPRGFSTPSYQGLWSGYVHAGPTTHVRKGNDFALVAGTFLYRGQVGEPALSQLLHDYDPPFDRWDDVLGHFGALIFKNGRLFVFCDWLGAFHIYRTTDYSVVSTSLLAIAKSQSRLRFNDQAVYEFVFTGTAMGNDTVFHEITRLPRSEESELGERARTWHSRRPLQIRGRGRSTEELVETMTSKLRDAFSVPASHFGDRVQCPLSGGIDSRLVLALLQDQGVRPHIYVYGSVGDADVQIASKIAEAENFDLEVFDKSSFRSAEPDSFPEVVARNFHEMDGTPMDGGLFDSGGNSEARHARAKGGLAVSGAAGEIFRNYFYLANRRYRTRAVIDAFYAAYDPVECSAEFEERSYLTNLNQKLRNALEVGDEPLPRMRLEQAYPLFRCPAAFGREISMVGRFGPYFVPFCEQVIVQEAAEIPLDLRTFGRFETMLLNRISPKLAAYPSAYGHSFAESPSLRHKFAEGMSLARAPWLRRYSFRMKHLAKRPGAFGGFLAPELLSKVVDIEFPFMRRFFNTRNVRNQKHYGAIATLEYLSQRLADRLESP